MKRITIQGEAGCFHDATAHEYFAGEDIETIACPSFREMFDMLHADSNLIGTLAIENTIAGSLLQNHELLRGSDLTIVGEHKMYISQSLAALPGQELKDIHEVVSHPIALMQCEDYLLQHPWMKMVEGYDTAGCAKQIAERSSMGSAAICGTYAAQLYGLQVLAEDIQTNKRNFTRFLSIADRWVADEIMRDVDKNKSSLVFAVPHTSGSLSKADCKPNKASLAFTLPHEGGSLSKVLTIFSFYDLNLTKIQSLPIIGHEWEYRFYIDLTFTDYRRYRQSLDAVMPLINDFKNLGEYAEFTTK